MSSEDDSYYVDLYERHTEARSGRRARRRGSGGTESGRRRYGGHGRGSGPKSRRSQPWIGQNSARAAVLCGIFLLALYELAVLQDSMKAGELSKGLQGGAAGSKVDTLKHSQNTASEAGLTSKVSRSKLPKPPPAPEPETAAQNPDNSEDSGGNASTETTSKEPSGAGAVAAASQPPSTAPPPPPPPPRPPSQPEAPASIADSTPAPKRPPAELPGYPPRVKRDGEDSSPRRKKKQRRARARENPTDNETKPSSSVTNLEDSAADSNAEEKRPPASSERSHSSSPGKEGTEGSPKKKRPRKVDSPPGGESGAGAEPGSKENFWKWFQESKESEGSGASSIECPEENQKLCQMFYKFIRKYKIRSIYDASCAKNLGWIDVPLKKVGNELWGFKYHCGEVEPEKLEEAKSKLSEFSFVEFDNRQWWKAGFPEGIELLFAWDTLAHTAFGRVWSFFVNVRKQEIKWVLVDNYPGIMNNPSPKREFINLRKHPFRFPAPAAVVQDVREPGEDDSVKRQLLLYEGSSLPDNLG